MGAFDNFFSHIRDKYSKDDQALFAHIQLLYADAFDNRQQDAFLRSFVSGNLYKDDGETPDVHYTEEVMKEYHWRVELGDGELRTEAQNLIAYIANDQVERKNRITQKLKGYFLWAPFFCDPIALMFQAIKTWLGRDISRLNCSDENVCDTAKATIDKYLAFLESFLSQKSLELFVKTTQGSNEDYVRVKTTFKYVYKELEKIKSYIDVAQSKLSSRDFFKSFSTITKNMISEGVAYAYYIVQPNPTLPAGFDINRLMQPKPEDSAVTSTYYGKLLQHMMFLEPFAEWNGKAALPEGTSPPLLALIQSSATHFPSVSSALSKIVENDPKKKLTIGIVDKLNTQAAQKTYQIFLSQLLQLAYFREINQLFYDAAGIRGDVGTYGAGMQAIVVLYEQCGQLISELQTSFLALETMTKEYYHDTLGRQNSPKDWLDNYDKSRGNATVFARYRDSSKKNCAKIIANAQAFDLYESMKKLEMIKESLRLRGSEFLVIRGVDNFLALPSVSHPSAQITEAASSDMAVVSPAPKPAPLTERTPEAIIAELDATNPPPTLERSLHLLNFLITNRDSENLDFIARRAVVYLKQGEYKEAIADFDWVLDDDESRKKSLKQYYREKQDRHRLEYSHASAYYGLALGISIPDQRLACLEKANSIIEKSLHKLSKKEKKVDQQNYEKLKADIEEAITEVREFIAGPPAPGPAGLAKTDQNPK